MTIFRIRRWLRWLLDLTAVLIAENAFLGVTWSFCVIGLMTVFAFADASYLAGMLAATMSVNSSYLLGWSSVISQDVILPIRRALGKGALSSRKQIFVNRAANLFVSLFLMFWGLYYTPPGAVYLYLNITGTIFLAGAFVSVVGGLYWRRSNTTGGYAAMLLGAAGAIIPYFFLHWGENVTGFAAFGLAAGGLVFGSLLGRASAIEVPKAATVG